MKMRNKKLISILAIVVLLFAIIPASVNAAETAKFTVGSVNAKAGQEVSVDFKLDGSLTATTFTTSIVFDKTKLEVTGVTTGALIENAKGIAEVTDMESANTAGEIVVTVANSANQTFSSGVLATVKFKVKADVSGAQALTVTSEAYKDVDGEEVDISDTVKAVSGKITVVVPMTGVTLNKTSETLNVGDVENLVATVSPENTTDDKTVTWTTSDSKVVTVENGKVTAVGAGNAVVTATAGSFKAEYKVVVKAPLTKIELNKETLNLKKGDSDTLTVKYTPENTTDDKTVTWSTSDATIATVKDGKVTAIKDGTATVTAKVGDKTAECTVVVKEIKIESVSIGSDFELVKGNSKDLTAKITPENTTDDKTVTWSTSDSKVATVENGKVTAVATGTATITATVGDKKAEVTVTVKEIKLEAISMDKDFELTLGDSKELTVAYTPENTTDDKTVTWSTSDDKVVTVENGKVTAVAVGEATITAKVGNKETTVKVTVPEVKLEGIEVALETASIKVGETTKIVGKTIPENVTEEVTAVFTSSDEEVATVDSEGTVKGVKAGKATITVKVNDTFEKTLEIEVKEKTYEVPKTGDIAIGAFVVLMVISTIGIAVIVRKKLAK